MSKNVGIETTQKIVATAGTQLAIVAKQTFISMFVLSAPPSNTGRVYVGDVNAEGASGGTLVDRFGWQLSPGETISVSLPKNAGGEQIKLDARVLYVDADNNGDLVNLTHFNC